MIFRALIIDDIEKSRISLAHDLETYCPQIHVIGEADGVKTGARAIREKKPDVVFLDIEMADGTGFDLLEQVRDITFQVIFTTGMDSYGIKAIKFSALDYLLKPVDPDELVKAVGKLEANSAKTHVSQGVELLLQNLKTSLKPNERRIALHSADKVELVIVDDIVRCESQGAYTLFHLRDGRQVLATRNLREFEVLLDEYGFIRVHHSHLINFGHLKEFVKRDGGYAVMSDRSQIPVSTRKRTDLLKMIGE